MKELWWAIPDFSRYEASNLGRLRSLDYKNSGKTRVLKPALSGGYLKTMLQKDDGTYKSWNVHKFVAITFLMTIPDLEVNHVNGIKTDNRVCNLEYVTRSENILHAIRLGLQPIMRGSKNGMSKVTEYQVRDIRVHAANNGRFYGRKMLAEKYGISEAQIKAIVSKRVWSHVA